MALKTYSMFLTSLANRTVTHLLNPRVLSEDQVSLFKKAVVHWLDLSSEARFPSRDLPWFQDLSDNKKIYVDNIEDLRYKEMVAGLANKHLKRDVFNWYRTNRKDFRLFDIEDKGLTDDTTVYVINYNTLKGLYRYKGGLLSKLSAYRNLTETYTTYVNETVEAYPDSHHVISLNIPTLIPSYMVMERICGLKPVKYLRTIKSSTDLMFIEFYKWLTKKHREESVYSHIKVENSPSIVLEFKYKGYYSYVPLDLLMSLNEETDLEFNIKLNPVKFSKFFLGFITRITKQVDSLLDKDTDEVEDVTDLDTDSDNEEEVNISAKKHETSQSKNYKGLLRTDEDVEKSLQKAAEVDVEKELDSLIKESEDHEFEDQVISSTISHVENTKEKLIEVEKEEKTEEEYDFFSTAADDPIALIKDRTVDDKISDFIEYAKTFKTVDSNTLRSLVKARDKRKAMKSVYADVPLDQFIKIDPKDKQLTPEIKHVDAKAKILDEEYKKDTIVPFTKQYVSKVMKKDIEAALVKLEDAGVVITDHKVEEVRDTLGNYELHTVSLKPFIGRESTVTFRIPILDQDGRFKASGIKYILRKQKIDLPIRKINPTKVQLSSNYGKLFVSLTERKAYDYYDYIVTQIKKAYLDPDNDSVSKIEPANNFDNKLKLPPLLSYFTMNFDRIKLKDYTIEVNRKYADAHVDDKLVKDMKSKGYHYFGYNNKTKVPLFIDMGNQIFEYSNQLVSIGTIETLLGIDPVKSPVTYSVARVLGKDFPVGVLLGYYIGLNNLIKLLGAKVRLHKKGKRLDIQNNESLIRFEDYYLIYDKRDTKTAQLLSGFNFFSNAIKNYPIEAFNDKNVYLTVIESRGLNTMHLKEADLLRSIFIDPITKDILRDINEPSEFIPLLLRANELLTNFDHPDQNDPTYSRVRSEEIIPAMIYKTLSSSIRSYNLKGGTRKKIDLDPYGVWNAIIKDNTLCKIAEDINPIMDLKERENVSLTGPGGIDKGAMPEHLRVYHPNDLGLISEATVDSSDVAINTYLTPQAKIKDIRGLVDRDEKADKPYQIFSTSSQLSPYVTHDDPKRVNFVNIQNSHVIMAYGYRQPTIRTEYEYLMPYRVSSLYAFVAEQDGKVIDLTDKNMRIKYKDGTEKAFTIGNVYSKAEGSVYKHTLVPRFNKGQTFKKSDILYYNTGFFEEDWLTKDIIIKYNRNATVALATTNEVAEDASAISSELSKEMSTRYTKLLSYVLDFDKEIVNVVKEGDHVEPDTVLFTVLDEVTDVDNLSEDALSLLSSLTNFAPKAKVRGEVERFEVFYNGDKADMAKTLRRLVTRIENDMIHRSKGTDYEIKSAQVSSEYRVEGKNLAENTLELKIYIGYDLSAAIGDKLVFSTQLKSVISDVFEHSIQASESKDKIDAFFSYNSVANRITLSPLITGILNRILRKKGKEIADKFLNT